MILLTCIAKPRLTLFYAGRVFECIPLYLICVTLVPGLICKHLIHLCHARVVRMISGPLFLRQARAKFLRVAKFATVGVRQASCGTVDQVACKMVGGYVQGEQTALFMVSAQSLTFFVLPKVQSRRQS